MSRYIKICLKDLIIAIYFSKGVIKMKMIRGCLLIFLSLILISCVSSQSPNTLLSSQSFSLTSPNEEGWSLGQEWKSREKDYYLKTGERIWLKRGTIGGNWQLRDFPIKNILILRETISDTIVNEERLRTRLNEIAKVEVKRMVDSLITIPSDVENFHYLPSNDKDYFQFSYKHIYGLHHLSEPDTGIGQYYVYLPKYYNENKSYYLFIYDEFPYRALGPEVMFIVERFKCIEDSVSN